MARILLILDETSYFSAELAMPAAAAVQDFNGGNLPAGLSVPASHRRGGRFTAFQHGEMVIAIWTRNSKHAGEPSFTLPRPRLSLRENQVLQLLANGLTVKQIAEELHLATRTIRLYVSSLNHKLGTQSTEQSVGKGIVLGLCRMPGSPNPGG
jgi:DNA-binding CsgD family transcriptional regulator